MSERRGRPPWNQELTREEADEMLAAAREVGGEVAAWAVHVYYIQSALASERDMLRRQLARAHRKLANARRVRRERLGGAAVSTGRNT